MSTKALMSPAQLVSLEEFNMAVKKDGKDKVSASENQGLCLCLQQEGYQYLPQRPPPDDAIAAPAETVNVDDFARLIASMSRLLVGLAS